MLATASSLADIITLNTLKFITMSTLIAGD